MDAGPQDPEARKLVLPQGSNRLAEGLGGLSWPWRQEAQPGFSSALGLSILTCGLRPHPSRSCKALESTVSAASRTPLRDSLSRTGRSPGAWKSRLMSKTGLGPIPTLSQLCDLGRVLPVSSTKSALITPPLRNHCDRCDMKRLLPGWYETQLTWGHHQRWSQR